MNKKLIGLIPLVFTAGLSHSQASKPNIVFILTDDLGWMALACYGN
jgi:hypothetical protein